MSRGRRTRRPFLLLECAPPVLYICITNLHVYTHSLSCVMRKTKHPPMSMIYSKAQKMQVRLHSSGRPSFPSLFLGFGGGGGFNLLAAPSNFQKEYGRLGASILDPNGKAKAGKVVPGLDALLKTGKTRYGKISEKKIRESHSADTTDSAHYLYKGENGRPQKQKSDQKR